MILTWCAGEQEDQDGRDRSSPWTAEKHYALIELT